MRALLLLFSSALCVADVAAQDVQPIHQEPEGLRTERVFPLMPSAAFGGFGLKLAPRDIGAALPDERRVRFVDVPWPGPRGVETIQLRVERWQAMTPEFTWFVDGVPSGRRSDLEAHVRLYAGRVDGELDSHVYMALTSTGTWGWIRRGIERVHLFSTPESGSWQAPTSFLLHQSDPALPEPQGFSCAAKGTSTPSGAGVAAHADILAQGWVWKASMAVETDYQYYQLFGDVQAATNYALSLFGAVSERYLGGADTLLRLPYLGIYSNSNDPWTRQDTGGPLSEVLREFTLAWGSSPLPGNAHMAHMLSGAILGGGLANVDKLCDPSEAFAVSADLHGMLNFPVSQAHNLNWDLLVAAHETGHIFGSPHTHEFCPPIDQCVVSPLVPPSCQGQVQCQPGTLMGYCHVCPGGISNVRMDFHPTVGGLMRRKVAASCLPSYAPARATVRNGLGINPLGYRSWTAPQLGTTWWTTVDLTSGGAAASLIAVVPGPPFQGFVLPPGEVLIDLTQGPLAVPLDVATGQHTILVPNDTSLLGVLMTTQAAAVSPGGMVLQNAIDATLGY